jgi:hypothetical protein
VKPQTVEALKCIQHKNLWSCENLPNSGVYTGKRADLEAEEQRWLDNFWEKRRAEYGN